MMISAGLGPVQTAIQSYQQGENAGQHHHGERKGQAQLILGISSFPVM